MLSPHNSSNRQNFLYVNPDYVFYPRGVLVRCSAFPFKRHNFRGFYVTNHLYDDIDSEVYYAPSKYEAKPFLGIVVGIGTYTYVADTTYKIILEKEYRFCQGIQDGILQKVSQIYSEQKESGQIHRFYCDFTALEGACDKYKKES